MMWPSQIHASGLSADAGALRQEQASTAVHVLSQMTSLKATALHEDVGGQDAAKKAVALIR